MLTAGGKKQYLYGSPYRGYMSTVDERAHFGLGRAHRVDSLQVVWPDGRRQLLTNVDVDRLLVVKQVDASSVRREHPPTLSRAHPTDNRERSFFELIDPRRALAYKHQARTIPDYSIQ